jgi:hypothetical protein
MTRTFVITLAFERQWTNLSLNDEDPQKLEMIILENPQVGDVITGTSGLRKMRFSLEKGKSSGARIMYVDFATYQQVYLIGAFSKKEKENLTQSEKNEIKKIIIEIGKALEKGGIKNE